MDKKEYFSRQSRAYAAFRPTYPEELYQFIFEYLENRSCAWDCATGNGQVAKYLANHFETVYATDISQQQLSHAFQARNILYSAAPAEKAPFQDHLFDLITVAQALHWFDLQLFYREVRRTGKAGGLLAVWGYALLTVEPGIDEMFMDFYGNTVGPYWDDARRLVENHYRDIPFPFEEIPCPDFYIRVNWSLDEFTGYLSSWSATQKYIQVNNVDPLAAFAEKLSMRWGERQIRPVTFPIFMKMGRISG